MITPKKRTLTSHQQNMENVNSVDQTLDRVRKLMAAAPDRFAAQGSVVASWRTVSGNRFGPYYLLRYRDGGRQRSLYLGRSEAVADVVRRRLAEQQGQRRRQLVLRKLRTAVKASLRRHLQDWRSDLNDAGLKLKGMEIRNWKSLRSAPNGGELRRKA